MMQPQQDDSYRELCQALSADQFLFLHHVIYLALAAVIVEMV
jgi:hypothetical protein